MHAVVRRHSPQSRLCARTLSLSSGSARSISARSFLQTDASTADCAASYAAMEIEVSPFFEVWFRLMSKLLFGGNHCPQPRTVSAQSEDDLVDIDGTCRRRWPLQDRCADGVRIERVSEFHQPFRAGMLVRYEERQVADPLIDQLDRRLG